MERPVCWSIELEEIWRDSNRYRYIGKELVIMDVVDIVHWYTPYTLWIFYTLYFACKVIHIVSSVYPQLIAYSLWHFYDHSTFGHRKTGINKKKTICETSNNLTKGRSKIPSVFLFFSNFIWIFITIIYIISFYNTDEQVIFWSIAINYQYVYSFCLFPKSKLPADFFLFQFNFRQWRLRKKKWSSFQK